MNRKYIVVIFLIVLALLTRLPELSQRPLHVDEAVNAYILGELIGSGTYVYNPGEYHGPTLYYFSDVITHFAGVSDFAGLSAILIRLIPVLAGLGSVCLVFLLADLVHEKAGLPAALIIIFSPMMTYFNRYYIHESLLVLLVLIFLFLLLKYGFRKSYFLAALIGIITGLIISTKETWILYAVAISAAAFLGRTKIVFPGRSGWQYLMVLLFSTGTVIFLFYSSFFTNPSGLSSFSESFIRYFNRGTETPEHTHPWYYYLNILFFYRTQGMLFLSEVLPLLLALTGIIFVFRSKSEPGRFFAFYAIVLLAIFSVIPYKTPWNILGIVPVLAILGGCAIIFIFEKMKSRYKKYLLAALLITTFFFEASELYRINYLYASDMSNPFTYGHARDDVLQIEKIMEDKFLTHDEFTAVEIAVIAGEGDYWPLPWYLRKFKYVGWWNSVPQSIADAQVILIAPELEPALVKQLFESTPFEKRHLYLPLFEQDLELRPGVSIRGYIRLDLWQALNADSAGL